MTISRDDFTRWREDPVTRAVLEAHRKTADDNREAWVKQSWDNGHANPLALIELRTRADAYMAIVEMTCEDVCEALGMPIEQDDNERTIRTSAVGY